MKTNLLDKFFKDQLSHLDGGDPSGTWAALSEKLDANLTPDTTEDLSFDQNIKDNISDLNVIEMPDWENFLPSLQLDENLGAIENDIALDKAAKEKLENIEAEYDAATWGVLKEKLDLEDILVHERADADLDQLSYDKLLNYTVPQRAGDWDELEKKLDREFVLPFKLLFKYKIAELAILSSLILIFFQAKPIIDGHKQEKVSITEIRSEQTTSNDIDLASPSLESIAQVKKSSTTSKESKKDIKDLKQVLEPKNSAALNVNGKGTVTVNTTFDSNEVLSKGAFISPANEPFEINNQESFLEISSAVTPVISANDEQSPREETKNLVVAEDYGLKTVMNTASLPPGMLVNLDYSNKAVQFCKSCINTNSILRWRLGAHLDAKFDYIMTAYDKIFDLESYNHTSIAYGAGLSTSLLLGKWELESGFDYATRQYRPKVYHEFLGNFSLGYLKVNLDKIQMNILSIPLNLRYHFKDRSAKTHFYLHAGATLNIATQANYFIKSEFVGNTRRPDLNESKDLVEESNTISDKIYSLGWFDGGSYLENRYYSANLGFGFERKISARYSIFGQGTYSQYLDRTGLGPNDDRFNSVSISTGIRALFR